MATGLFDDLIPQAPRNVTGAFDDLIPATTGQGLLGAAQRGVQSAQQVFPVFQLLGAQDRGPSIRQERAAFEQAMSDPRYMASLTESFDEPLRAAKVEETLGPERKLGDIRQRQEAVKQIWSGVVTDIEKEKAATPKSAAQVELSQAQTASDKWRAWLKNPVELTATIVAESLPASIAGAVLGTATAGPGIGTAAGVGLSSFATTLSSELLNEASRMGYDISDQQSLERFVSSQDFDRAFNTATTKAAPVANIDAATAGAAGRFIAPAIKQGLGSAARATGKEVLQQAIGGSGGEFVGQTLAGQPKDWFDIAMEGVAEIFTAPGEAISNIRRTRRIGAEPQDRPVISRIERPPDATTQREIQESVQPQRIETTTRGVPDEAGTRDIVQPTTPVQTQTPEIVQVPALAPGAFKPGDQIAQYGRVLNVDMDQGTVTTQSEDGRRYVLIGQQEIPIATIVEPAPDQPVFPLRKGTTTPWEDQRGRPVRLIPDPANPDRQKWAVEEAPAAPPAPEQKIAPVVYRGFQEGIPGKFEGFHLYNLTETISPTLVKGSTVTEQKLNAEGFTVPESVKPAQAVGQGIGQILQASAPVNESPETGPFILRTAPGEREIKLGVNMKQLMALVGPQMYSKPIVEVAVKELVQNALDISRAAGSTRTNPKVIDVQLDPEGRTITVEDRGLGMTPDIIQSAFFTIGGTHKEGTPENTSGGLGLAKMAFILGSERIRLETIRGGVKSVVDASSDEIRNSTFKILQSKARPGEQSGTKVTVTIPKTYTNSEGEPQEIWFYHDSDFLKEPLIADVKVRLNGEELPLGVNLKGWQKENRFNFSWGHIDMYVDPTRSNYPRIKVLSSGLYQFEDYMNWGDVQFPYNIVLDVRPKVKTDNAAYPFNNQREGWRGTVSEDVKAMHNYLQQMAVEHQLLEAKETFAGLQRLPKFDPTAEWSEQELEDFMARYRARPKTSGEAAQDRIKQIDFSGPTITFEFESGKTTKVKKQDYVQKSFRPERDINLGAATLDVSQIDPSEPQFHNNTTADFSETPGSTAMFAEIGNTLLLFMRDFGNRIHRYNALAETSPTGWFGGISIDKSYRGLNMIKPMKAIWFNPAMMSQDAQQSPLAAASEALHIFIHEVTHVKAREEGAGFTSELANNYARLRSSGLGVELYEKTLERIFAKHWDTFRLINGLVQDYNTKNRATSFKSSAATGPPTGPEQAGTAGSPQIYAAGVGGVPEQGPGSTAGTRPADSGTGTAPNVASPKTQEEMDRALAVKEAEEEGWVKHRALGVDDWVLARDQWTDEEKLRSRQQAEETFTNAGIPHTWNEQNRYFDIQPGATVEAQYRLLDLVKEAMRRQNWPKEPEVAALIASITANAKLGQTDYFDSYVRRQLYKLTRSEASHRGALLGALSHFARDIREVSLRVEEILERTWADAYGGPAVEKVAEDLAKSVQEKAKDPAVAQKVLDKAPELTRAGVDAGLIGQIFQMPFFTQAELKERFIAAVVKKTRVTPSEATKLWNVFKEKFDPIRRELGRLALAEVKSLLRPDQRHLIKKPIWQKIQSMVDAGEFDAGHILKIIAGEKGWRTPTPEEISKLRQLARRERELRELNDKERAEVEKFAPNDEKAMVKAQLEKEKKTEQQRNAILREMDTRWARFTRPISLNPFKWFGLRHNTASAGLELIAANLLATIGFPFRLSISIASQILPHMTLTPIAYSWQQHQGTLDTLEGQKNFIRDAYLGLEDSISAYLKSVKPAAYAARAAFLGRGEQRNVLRLTSSIAAFDRIRLMAQEEFEKGNVAKAMALKTLGFLDIGFRAARALDAFQTLPAETAEMYHQIRLEMGSQGKSLTEIKNNQYTIMDRIFREWMQAIADTKKGLADAGVTDATEAQIKEIAWTLIRQRQYQKANELKLSGDDWQRMNRLLKSTLAWNEAETKGAGGVVGGALKRIQRGVSKGLGIPTDIGVFSNAIATAINRQLHFTVFYHLLGGGRGEGSPWFATEIDKKRRALDALAGTGFGSIVIAMVLMGIIKVQLPRRMDDDEKEKFIAEGHRFGTVEFQYGDTFVPVSINNSPLWIVAPYLAGAGAFMDLQERRQKEQEKLNAEAAKKGLPPGKIRPMDPGDMAGVAGQAAWQTIFGSRTFSGFLGSIASYGEKLNTRRIIAGRIAPMVPGLPAVREVVSRMGGVTLNNQLAAIWDYMLPLPSSQAAMVNKLGDPVRTPSDLQRVVQVLSGGNYGPVAKQETQAYQTLYGSEFKPPTISPNKGYQFPDSFRPMNDRELAAYSRLRGRYFQEGLAGIAAGDEAAVKSAYQQAERRALTEVGVQVPVTTTSSRGTTTTRRTGVRGPRRLRSVSRLRRPRLRRLSYRRPRLAVRRPRLRRIRRLAA